MLARDAIQRLADQLLDERLELLSEIRLVEQDLSELQDRPVSDREERGQERDRAEVLARMDEAARRRLQEIDEALGRIAHNEYGRCMLCGAIIALERLEAMPTVRECLNCARGSGQPGPGSGSPSRIRR